MKRCARVGTLLAVLACLALFAAPVRAEDSVEERASPWWDWWSWADGWFGLSFGGVSYGDPAHRVIGSDKLVHDVRAVAGARAIEVHGPFDIVLRQGPSEKLTLHTDDNIAPLLESEVRDGVLRLAVRPGASFHVRHAIGATIELPQLETLRIFGSSNVICAQFKTPNLALEVAGSGDLRLDSLQLDALQLRLDGKGDVLLSGAAQRLELDINGAGRFVAPEFSVRDARVRINGVGSAQIWAKSHLDVAISGAGSVHYRGPASVTQSISGIGIIQRD